MLSRTLGSVVQVAPVTISDDYLSATDALPPSFTVFTGRDFSFDAAGATSAAASYNTRYRVELANDEAFTVNLVSSGDLADVAVSADGVPMATWSPAAGDWDTLESGGTYLYYRATTWDSAGGNVRTSDHYNAGAVALPVTRAVINATGDEPVCGDCSSQGRSGTSLAGLGLGLGLLVLRRRRGRVLR